jgi:hypothetical protein
MRCSRPTTQNGYGMIWAPGGNSDPVQAGRSQNSLDRSSLAPQPWTCPLPPIWKSSTATETATFAANPRLARPRTAGRSAVTRSFAGQPETASADSEVRPDPGPTLRPHHHKTPEAGPGALSTSSLPSMRFPSMASSRRPRLHRTACSGAVSPSPSFTCASMRRPVAPPARSQALGRARSAGPIVLIRPGSASTPTWASSPGDGRRRVGRVQVAGDSCQVQPHRLHRPARIAGPQRGDQLVVIDLVFLPALG